MNTEVPYKTPSCRNKYGRYRSRTYITPPPPGFLLVQIDIHITWFNQLGWYYGVNLALSTLKQPCILEFSDDRRTWRKGKELPICAEAAEKDVARLLFKHGISMPKLTPFTLGPNY
jgi:hypothetical protein